MASLFSFGNLQKIKRSHQRMELVKQINQWDESNPEVARQMAVIMIDLLSTQFQLSGKPTAIAHELPETSLHQE